VDDGFWLFVRRNGHTLLIEVHKRHCLTALIQRRLVIDADVISMKRIDVFGNQYALGVVPGTGSNAVSRIDSTRRIGVERDGADVCSTTWPRSRAARSTT
jgi:hypothetical protein